MPKKSLVLLFVFGFILKYGISYSQGAAALNSLIDEALKNNPTIQAAKARYEAGKSRVRLLRTLEDPKFEYEYDKITADMDAVMRGKTGPMRTFSISQEIPFPAKLILRKQSAQKEADSLEQEYKETQRKIIKETKEAYFQIFLNHKKILLTKDNMDLLKQFIEVINAKYAVNKANQQDSLRAQVEYSKLSNQLVLLEQELKISEAMLNSLLNRPPETEIGIPEEGNEKNLDFNEEKILKLTRDNRPELKSVWELARKSEIDLALSKLEYMPDFMVKYKREERNGGAGSWAGTLGVTLPIWFWDKQDSFVKEAKANVDMVKAEYQATENMTLFEARSALAKFEAARNLVKIYETGVLPQAEAALETARLGYQADKIDFLELLDTQRTLREFQMEYFESLANLEISLADLERSIGMDLS